jgi:hypothetical protein
VGAHIPMFMSQVCDDEKWHSMHDIGAHTHTLSRCRYLDISANTGLVCVPLSLVILIYSRCLCPHTAILYPHNAIYMFSYCDMYPHTAIYMSSFFYICFCILRRKGS